MKSEIADIFYNLHVTAFDPYEWRIKNFPRIASVFMEPIYVQTFDRQSNLQIE